MVNILIIDCTLLYNTLTLVSILMGFIIIIILFHLVNSSIEVWLWPKMLCLFHCQTQKEFHAIQDLRRLYIYT